MNFENCPIDAGCYIRTFTGIYLNPFDIKEEDIDIRDIAHALSLICRFGGHCKKFYSVAEHCIMVSYNLPEHLRFEGLMHDASEAYLVDMPSPIKEKLPEYKVVETNIMNVVAKKFGISWPVCEEVKKADRLGLEHEWHNNVVCEAAKITPYSSEYAERAFLKRFAELRK